MAVGTNAIVMGYRSAEEIASLLEASYGQPVSLNQPLSLKNTMNNNVSIATFNQNDGKQCAMYVFTNGYCAEDYHKIYQGEATYLSLLHQEDSVAIMRGILERTGGHLIPNDCSDDALEYVSAKTDLLLVV
jgi:hypothetical protein